MATRTNNRERRLQELSGSDYEVVDGEPDIRDWDVKNTTGQDVGEIDDLIFDTESLKVRYAVVDLDDNDLDLDDRKVLIPIGLIEVTNEDDKEVMLNNVTVDQLRALPKYDDEDNLNPEYESGIRRVFGGVGSAAMTGAAYTSDKDRADFYNHEHFNDENLYRNRRQAAGMNTAGMNTDTNRNTENNRNMDNDRNKGDKTIPVVHEELNIDKREEARGGIRLRSRIVEKPVEETVNLRTEKVNVERTPADRKASEADFREGEMEIRERSEVPVVNKEARVVEEVKVNKEVTERNETIRDTVRETKVDVDKLDKNDRRNDTSNDSGRY